MEAKKCRFSMGLYIRLVILAGCLAALLAGVYLELPREASSTAGRTAFLAAMTAAAALLIGLGLGNEKAHSDAAERIAGQQAMQHVSWSLVGAATADELSHSFVRAVSEALDAPFVTLYLPGAEERQLVIAAVCGVDDPSVSSGKVCSLERGFRPGFHNGHTSRAYAGGSVEVVPDIFSDVEFLPWRLVAKIEGMVVSVPLPHQSSVIGVFNLFLPGVRSVGEGKIRLLEAIARAVAPAIENMGMQSSKYEELDKVA